MIGGAWPRAPPLDPPLVPIMNSRTKYVPISMAVVEVFSVFHQLLIIVARQFIYCFIYVSLND